MPVPTPFHFITKLKKIHIHELKCHTKNKNEVGLKKAIYFINLGYLELIIAKIPGILKIKMTLFNLKKASKSRGSVVPVKSKFIKIVS